MSDILSLLVPPGSSKRSSVRRPLIISAMLAALGSGVALMLPLMALALVGWLATGAVGTTRGALRVGADAWLLAHGAGLDVSGSTVTFIPLGLTVFSLWVCFRTGRWAAGTSEIEEPVTLAVGVFAFTVSLGLMALVTAVLASVPAAQPGMVRAFLGACAVGAIGGGSGLVSGSDYRLPVPEPIRVAAAGASAMVLAMLATGSVLVAVAFLAHFGTAASLLSQLHVHTAGGLLVLAGTFAVAPNLSLFGAAYLLGPGFAVGTGTIVSPTDVLLGPVPAVPFVAALPDGTPPWWTSLLVVVPVLVVALVAAAQRPSSLASRIGRAAEALVRGVLTGLLAALGTTAAVVLAGGAIGPGRMQDIGAAGASILMAATIASVVGAVVGSLFGSVVGTGALARLRNPLPPLTFEE